MSELRGENSVGLVSVCRRIRSNNVIPTGIVIAMITMFSIARLNTLSLNAA